MSTDLDKLNRLRVNAGKPELKSWKASKDALAAQIVKFEEAGFTDALPGANVDAAVTTDDPEIIANLESEAPKPLSESALAKNIGKQDDAKPQPKTTKVKAHLARGLDTELYARNCRKAVYDARQEEKRAAKEAKKNKSAVELTTADKKQIADEASSRKGNIAGKVNAKKDPAKAKRQEEHVAAKQKARAESGKKPKDKNSDEITMADIARELGKDPKVIRAKARRHEAKLNALHTKGQDRWTFPAKCKDEIMKILGEGK